MAFLLNELSYGFSISFYHRMSFHSDNILGILKIPCGLRYGTSKLLFPKIFSYIDHTQTSFPRCEYICVFSNVLLSKMTDHIDHTQMPFLLYEPKYGFSKKSSGRKFCHIGHISLISENLELLFPSYGLKEAHPACQIRECR